MPGLICSSQMHVMMNVTPFDPEVPNVHLASDALFDSSHHSGTSYVPWARNGTSRPLDQKKGLFPE